MAARDNCFAYSEKVSKEWIPGTDRWRKFLHLECRALRRMYCTFEDCNFFKTQAFLDEERRRCSQRLKRIEEEKKRERKQQGEGSKV